MISKRFAGASARQCASTAALWKEPSMHSTVTKRVASLLAICAVLPSSNTTHKEQVGDEFLLYVCSGDRAASGSPSNGSF